MEIKGLNNTPYMSKIYTVDKFCKDVRA